jgi:hypothetical protein
LTSGSRRLRRKQTGAEYALAPNWSIKAEYLYLDFGTMRYEAPFSAAPEFTMLNDIEMRMHTFRVGINYRWDKSVGTPASTRRYRVDRRNDNRLVNHAKVAGADFFRF